MKPSTPRDARLAAHATDLYDLDEIRDFLLANPGFVRDDPELLHAVAGSSRNDGVVAIADLARDRLAARARTLESRARWIVETAEANADVLRRVEACVLAAVGARDPYALAEALDAEIAPILGVEAAVVRYGARPAAGEALDPFAAQVQRLIPDEGGVRLGPIDRDRIWLYGEAAAGLRGEALVRLTLGADGAVGVFALATRDPHAFRPDDATDRLRFLAAVIERLVGGWMDDGRL